MYNLLEYSKNYRKTTGSLWNYYRDEASNLLSSNSEFFKYKASITGKIYNLVVGDDDYYAKMKLKFCTIKTFQQFLENFKYTID